MIRWRDYLNTGDLEGVLSMYDENAALIPTFSSRTLTAPLQRRDYFEHLLRRPGLHVSIHEKAFASQPADEDTHILYGLYTFRFEIDGNPLSFEGRFTIVANPSRPSPILHHHSSQIPRTLC